MSDPQTGPIVAGWSTTLTITIAPGWVSGLYLAVPQQPGATTAQYASFVVREAIPEAPILWVSPVTTHEACNGQVARSAIVGAREPDGRSDVRACRVHPGELRGGRPGRDSVLGGDDAVGWALNAWGAPDLHGVHTRLTSGWRWSPGTSSIAWCDDVRAMTIRGTWRWRP